VLAITEVDQKDQKDLAILVEKARDNYINRYVEIVKQTGGQLMGPKHMAKKTKEEKRRQKEVKL